MAAKANKHTPIRTCVGCRKQRAQSEMRRFVREGARWSADPDGARRAGRGAYLCSAECVPLVAKNRRYPGLATAAEEYGLISSSIERKKTDG